jgi:hypothetical protein
VIWDRNRDREVRRLFGFVSDTYAASSEQHSVTAPLAPRQPQKPRFKVCRLVCGISAKNSQRTCVIVGLSARTGFGRRHLTSAPAEPVLVRRIRNHGTIGQEQP